MFSLLATMVVTTCVIFVVGVVGGGPFGGGIAMMAAMAAMLGGVVGVRFVTSSGDTLERESYPFPGLWPRGSK